MILIQFHWVLTVVVVVMSVGFLSLLRRQRKYHRKAVSNHEVSILNRMRGREKEYHDALDEMKENSQAIIDKQGVLYERNVQARNELLRGAVPGMVHVAKSHEGTEAAKGACRWLYAANCLGVWTSNKETSRILARGQALCGANPTEFDTVMRQIIADNQEQEASEERKEECMDG